MATLRLRRAVSSTPSQSSRLLIKTTPTFIAEPLEARRLLSDVSSVALSQPMDNVQNTAVVVSNPDGATGLLANANAARSIAPVVSISSPFRNEVWQAGISQAVNWTISGNTGAISYLGVGLSIDGGATFQAVSPGLPITATSFSFTPTAAQASGTAQIVVWAADAANNMVAYATSNGFTIDYTAPVLRISSPAKGTVWQAGDPQAVNWTVSGDAGTISYLGVAISTDGGATYQTISPALDATATSFTFTPTAAEASGNVKILLWAADKQNNMLASATSATVTIQDIVPVLAISSPFRQTVWQAGDPQAVNWTVSGDVGTIGYLAVAISTDGGATYQTISPALPATATSFTFTPTPAQSGSNVKILVWAADTQNHMLASATSYTFTIQYIAPTLGITSPIRNTVWQAGTPQAVNWTVGGDAGTISYFGVAISTDGGATYQTISPKLPAATTSFTFTPTANQAGSDVQIVVWAADANNNMLASATSIPFAIQYIAPKLVISSPARGTVWQVGTEQSVNWSVTGDANAIGYLAVGVSTDGGLTYTAVSPGLINSATSFSFIPTASQASGAAIILVWAADLQNQFQAYTLSIPFTIQL